MTYTMSNASIFSSMQIWMVYPERCNKLRSRWREVSTFMILEVNEYYRTVMYLAVHRNGTFRIKRSFIEDMKEFVECSKKIT